MSKKINFNSREDQGKFPDYPSDEEGGSALIFNPDLVIHDSDGEVIKTGDKGKKEEKREGEEEEEKGFRLGPSDFLNSLKDGDKTFSGKPLNNDGQPSPSKFFLYISFEGKECEHLEEGKY